MKVVKNDAVSGRPLVAISHDTRLRKGIFRVWVLTRGASYLPAEIQHPGLRGPTSQP